MPERRWKIKKPSGSGTKDLGVTNFHTRVKNNLNHKKARKNLHVQFSHRILRESACACRKKQFWIRDASSTNSYCKSERPGRDKKVSQINFSHSRENVWEAQHVCSVSLGYKDLYFRSNPDYFHTTSTQPLHELVIPTLLQSTKMDFKYTNQRSKEEILKREKARIVGINKTKAIHQSYKNSPHYSLTKPIKDRSNPVHYLSGPARQLPCVAANINGTVEIIASLKQLPPSTVKLTSSSSP